jgi:hypothetical protein
MALGRWRVSLIQMLGGTDKARNVQHAIEMIARAAAAVPASLPATATQPLVPTAKFTAWASLQSTDPAVPAATAADTTTAVVPRLLVLPECFNAPYTTSGPAPQITRRDEGAPGGKLTTTTVLPRLEHRDAQGRVAVRMGVAICFDIRFPQLAQHYALHGTSMLCVPAAFPLVSGARHWHLLARMRAVDTRILHLAVVPRAAIDIEAHARQERQLLAHTRQLRQVDVSAHDPLVALLRFCKDLAHRGDDQTVAVRDVLRARVASR